MKITTSKAAVIIAVLLLISPVAHAQTTWQGTADSSFGNVANWTNNTPGNAIDDGANNVATIDNGGTVDLTTNYTSDNPFRLEVGGNSTLNISADVTVSRLNNLDAGSTINILDGANFVMPQVSGGNNNGYSINGDLVISGNSTAEFNERLFGNGNIRVEGSDATVNFHQIVGAARSYELIFDAAGVSNIVGAGTSGAGPFWDLNGSTLLVDASAFSGGGIFNLFETTTNAFGTFNAADITVLGAGSPSAGGGPGYEIINRTEGGRAFVDLAIVQAVPEPSSALLLALGSLPLLLRRRSR